MAGMESNAPEILWTAGFFNERFPDPVSPLGWSLLGPLIESYAFRDPLRYLGFADAGAVPVGRLWHGHPYTNVLVFQVLYKVFPDFLLPEDCYRYFPLGNVDMRKDAPYPPSIWSPRLIFSIVRAFVSDPRNWSPFHNHRVWNEYRLRHDRRVQALVQAAAELEQSHAAFPEILPVLKQAEQAHVDLLRIHRWSLTHADLTYGLLVRLIRAWVDRDHAGEIGSRWVTGTPNKTLVVDAALRSLADQVQRSPLLRHAVANASSFAELERVCESLEGDGQRFLETVRSFLSTHGHRSVSLDVAVPNMADDPMQVVHWLRMLAEEPTPKIESGVFAGAEPGALAFWKKWLIGPVRSLAREYMGLREDQRYYWQKSLAVSRRLYLIGAAAMVQAGVIREREEVFFATHSELVEFADGRMTGEELAAHIAARRGEWGECVKESQHGATESYPDFMIGDRPLMPPPSKSWLGRGVSAGSATGRARVVKAVGELGIIEPGEILVAPSTDPGWTPVFGRIAGLVLERGGVLSHGAVVAREYGIPAVAGVAGISSEIQDGEIIEVNGSTGQVTRVHP